MAQIQLNRLTNASVYVDGNSMLGQAEEIKLPDITMNMTEHKALGMVGKIELPAGFDKLEGEIKWNSFYREAWQRMMSYGEIIPVQVRGNLKSVGARGVTAEVPYVVHLSVMFKKVPLGTFKQNDNVDFTSGFSCYYVKQVVAGEDVLELDVLANIYKVNGVDKLAKYRANIGG